MHNPAQSIKTGSKKLSHRSGLRRLSILIAVALLAALSLINFSETGNRVEAQAAPSMVDPTLEVVPVVSGLVTPISIAFTGGNIIGPGGFGFGTNTGKGNFFFVLEKNTGKVQVVANGNIQNTAIDLAVNFASERGLLGITLDPAFATNGFVYLYWTCSAPAPADPCNPATVTVECPDTPQLGADTDDVLAVPLLGNRVDRFFWNGSTLTFDRNLIKLRVFQNDGCPNPPGQGDEAQPALGNHDGGIITFGPDGKLYIIIGDVGRRGQLQNLPSGPTATGLGAPVPDDQFGGPQPDDAHFTGVILRLNSDGTTPADNPFFTAGGAIGGEVGANIQKIFAYGFRNSFGMAFDPLSGNLWMQENGDDSFDELNLVTPGMNSGWIQTIGPLSRLQQYKEIETSPEFFGLQQLRWPPTRIADTQAEALMRLFVLPGSQFSDPEFSWKFAIAPAAIGFVNGNALGPQFNGDLIVGLSLPLPLGGPLLKFDLTANRSGVAVTDPRLADLVADNPTKRDLTESESLVIGRDFGIVTDIESLSDGSLFVVSLSRGTVYEIRRRP
ncbi:MAG TPA: PQQ-dependent sugar dehydrogenase [Blastocatellia bacterium]|nr:PQQ-dependent sugar dehydrogenase [Blastocatellia bacterium]